MSWYNKIKIVEAGQKKADTVIDKISTKYYFIYCLTK